MLIEVKVKVTRIENAKPKKRLETYLMDKDFFSQAEYDITAHLEEDNSITEYEIQSLRLSPIKEIAFQYEGQYSFIATLKDIFHDDEGNEKYTRYKVLLWANSLTEANHNVQELSKEGYDMLIESIKQVDYEYIGKEK
jgi:hypothetical protein